MIYIKKGKEPISLTAYKKYKLATFNDCNKADIRLSLLKEQGYLCAYCMRRIYEDNTRIEHWKPESKLTEYEKLDYSNMLGVCYKNSEGLIDKYQTCDTRKGKDDIYVDPRKQEHIDLIEYKKGSGMIFSKDERINNDLNYSLNLNCMEQNLPENRRAVLNRVIIELNKLAKKSTFKMSDIIKIKNIYEQPDSNGEKNPFAGIVIWYLNKKIKQNIK